MIQLIKNYINDFTKRAGNYVLAATILSRILSFLASWFALQFIDNQSLGVVLFAYNIILFLLPIAGLGLHQSLIRFGAIAENIDEKKQILIYVFKNGFWASIVLIFIVIVVCSFINFEFTNTYNYIILLAFMLLPSFFLEILRAQLRLQHKNKTFAYTDIVQNVILLVSVICLSYFFKELGYAIALVLTPIITITLFINQLDIDFKTKIDNHKFNFSFWKYGFFASLSNVVTQLLMIVDILLIGYLLKDTLLVTHYRYVSLLPYSLLFLPQAFIATDFVSFTENIKSKLHIYKYIKSYMLFFTTVSICLAIFCTLFSKQLLALISNDLVPYTQPFLTLIWGIIGIYIFRGLFGNLLSSIGKAHVNYYIATVALLVNIIANFTLIPLLGIQGAALTTAILMWVTGIASALLFFYYYKKLLSQKSN